MGKEIIIIIVWQRKLIKLFTFYLSDDFEIFNPTLLMSTQGITGYIFTFWNIKLK